MPSVELDAPWRSIKPIESVLAAEPGGPPDSAVLEHVQVRVFQLPREIAHVGLVNRAGLAGAAGQHPQRPTGFTAGEVTLGEHLDLLPIGIVPPRRQRCLEPVVLTCEMACRDNEIAACGDEATLCLDGCLLTVSGRTEDCGRCLAERSHSRGVSASAGMIQGPIVGAALELGFPFAILCAVAAWNLPTSIPLLVRRLIAIMGMAGAFWEVGTLMRAGYVLLT